MTRLDQVVALSISMMPTARWRRSITGSRPFRRLAYGSVPMRL